MDHGAPLLSRFFTVDDDDLYCSILPTATRYARNAIFSGLMPSAIARMFPDLWVDEEADESKNINESPSWPPYSTATAATSSFPTTSSTTRPGPTACCATSRRSPPTTST